MKLFHFSLVSIYETLCSNMDNPPEPVKLYEYVFKTPCGEEKVYSTFPLSEEAKAVIASNLLEECAEAIKDIKYA